MVASLADVSHVIIDEVHERSLDTDFLLVLLRDVLKKRKDLKLILMSATLDAGVFEDYFKSNGRVGRVEISGRTYPVEDYYLDDVIQMTGFNSGRGGRRDEDDADTAGMDSDVAAAIQSIGSGVLPPGDAWVRFVRHFCMYVFFPFEIAILEDVQVGLENIMCGCETKK